MKGLACLACLVGGRIDVANLSREPRWKRSCPVIGRAAIMDGCVDIAHVGCRAGGKERRRRKEGDDTPLCSSRSRSRPRSHSHSLVLRD